MKITNLSRDKGTHFKPESKISKLLDAIPQEHLIGLDRIVILDEVASRNKKTRKKPVGGRYVPMIGREPAYIELAIGNIFHGMPRVFFYLPFVTRFMLASVLFHEIGHHYARFTHGVTSDKQEVFANKYKTKSLVRAFRGWLVIFLPFRPLIRFLRKQRTV